VSTAPGDDWLNVLMDRTSRARAKRADPAAPEPPAPPAPAPEPPPPARIPAGPRTEHLSPADWLRSAMYRAY
jgi:hypothetical protein